MCQRQAMEPVLYQRVAADVRAQIKSGALKTGDKLPSTRELCEHYDVSTTVVRLAIMILKTEGLVVGISGKGVFVQ
jgi:DNA-binding GntR family transcriptional regulator